MAMNIRTADQPVAGETIRRGGFSFNINTSRVRRRFLIQLTTMQVGGVGEAAQRRGHIAVQKTAAATFDQLIESYYASLLARPR
ncbi:MAG: hypothetical protein ABI670_12915 [Chloroflexota bacterium]